MNYFIIVNDQQQGPFTIDELKLRAITADTLVWAEGMPEWVPAGQVDELKAILQDGTNNTTTTPPPPPVGNTPQQPQQAQAAQNSQADAMRQLLEIQAEERKREAEERKRRFRRNRNIVVIVAIIALFILALTNPNKAEHRQAILDRIDLTPDELDDIDNPTIRGIAQTMLVTRRGAVVEAIKSAIDEKLEYHNYVFFSTTTLRIALFTKQIDCSSGWLGHVSTDDISDLTSQIVLEEITKANSNDLKIDSSALSGADGSQSPEELVVNIINKAVKEKGVSVDSLTKKLADHISDKVSKEVKEEVTEHSDTTTANSVSNLIDQIINFLKNL